MSAFKIGQRVRVVVNIPEYPEALGTEARIVNVGVEAWAARLGDFVGCELDFVVIGVKFRMPGLLVVPDDHLEPILYDGNQLVSWESMKDLWTPAGGVAA